MKGCLKMKKTSDKIGVMVVSYNHRETTLNWLGIFFKMFGHLSNLAVLIVDNHSDDGTFEAVREAFPHVNIVRLKENYGCTRGRNIGIVELANLGCNYVCSLDNDVHIEDPLFFEKMLDRFQKHPEVDGYGTIVRWGDDRSICTLGSRRTWYGALRAIKTVTTHTRVNLLPGGASMIRVRAFRQYGLFDNDYPPIGGQDKAWGVRVTAAGANLHYNPDTEVFHYHDRTRADSAQKHAYVIEGTTIFLRKNFTLVNLLVALRYFSHQAKPYGFGFVWCHFVRAVRQKLEPDNYGFEHFCSTGMDQYYLQVARVAE